MDTFLRKIFEQRQEEMMEKSPTELFKVERREPRHRYLGNKDKAPK